MKNALLEKCIAIEIKLQQLHLVFAFVIFLPLRYNIPTSLNIYVPTIPDDWEIFKASREGGYCQVYPKWYWMWYLISSEIPLMESWKEYSATCALSYVIRSYIIIAPSYMEYFREVVIWYSPLSVLFGVQFIVLSMMWMHTWINRPHTKLYTFAHFSISSQGYT